MQGVVTPCLKNILYFWIPKCSHMNAKKKKEIKQAHKPRPDSKFKTEARQSQEGAQSASGFAFGKENYKLLFIGLAFIIVGFLLMVGGGSDDPKEFSYEIFNFRRLTLAPILILIGYVIEIFAIMKKPRD